MVEFRNTEGLPQRVQKVFIPFIQKLINLHEDRIVSVFLYGSATGKDFVERDSDINSVVVVRNIDLGMLEKSLKLVASVQTKRIVAPLILTGEHIRSSQDVFPIEFSDMKENYTVVYGEDVLKGLVIEQEHTRLFCEQQIKGKLIRIRQSYLEVGMRKSGIEQLLKVSLGSLVPVFRALLRLKGAEVPNDKGRVFEDLGKAFGVKTDVMSEIWKDQSDDERVGGRDVREALGRYIDQLEKLAEAVDRL